MGILSLIIIYVIIMKATGQDEKASDVFRVIKKVLGWGFGGLFLLSMLTSVIGSGEMVGVAFTVGLIFLIRKMIRKSQQTNYKKERQTKTVTNSGGAYSTRSTILPRPVGKRNKMVTNFNDRFRLYLTKEQIDRIVDASYISAGWKTEIEAMTVDYVTVYEWLQGPTAALRAYLYAFHVQKISSDFTQQEQIVTDSLNEVMYYADTLTHLDLQQRIEAVNNKFFTAFDDVTFMIAFRYLEGKGFRHTLDKVNLERNDSELDEMMKKYQTDATPSA
ncbi:MAG: hypothetical protein K5682_05145 [Lachnospiraceae bacterium]|nr:hypothetical protein [Lachnospiraceae bacterium]